jgi:hypothetical protein
LLRSNNTTLIDRTPCSPWIRTRSISAVADRIFHRCGPFGGFSTDHDFLGNVGRLRNDWFFSGFANLDHPLFERARRTFRKLYLPSAPLPMVPVLVSAVAGLSLAIVLFEPGTTVLPVAPVYP